MSSRRRRDERAPIPNLAQPSDPWAYATERPAPLNGAFSFVKNALQDEHDRLQAPYQGEKE